MLEYENKGLEIFILVIKYLELTIAFLFIAKKKTSNKSFKLSEKKNISGKYSAPLYWHLFQKYFTLEQKIMNIMENIFRENVLENF